MRLAFVGGFLTLGFAFCCLFVGGRTPTFSEVRSDFKPSDSWVLDRNGFPLQSIRTGQTHRSLDWVTSREISPSFRRLLIASEDHRFETHHGVDVLALAQASKHRGASTLTMQLANQIAKLRAPSQRENAFKRKFEQIFEALRLDHAWSKEKILEAYVNLVPFRGELIGLRAASVGLFQKSPSALDDNESALLVAMIRSPNASLEQVAKRACGLLKIATCSDLELKARNTLTASYQLQRDRTRLPVMSRSFIKDQPGAVSVQTTLDARAQEIAMQAVREQLRELRDKNVGGRGRHCAGYKIGCDSRVRRKRRTRLFDRCTNRRRQNATTSRLDIKAICLRHRL